MRGFEKQLEQSMGRVALFWRRLRSLHQRTMDCAVREFANTQQDPVMLTEPGKKAKKIDPVAIRAACYHIYPEADEGYPVLNGDKRQQLGTLIANPAFGPSVPQMANLRLIKRVLGFTEFKIAGEDAWDKQTKEIDEMLSRFATPDPDAVSAALAQGVPPPSAPTESSIPLLPFDDDAVELTCLKAWANSEEGIEAMTENPAAYQDIILHGQAHEARLKATTPPPPLPDEKPIAITGNIKDLDAASAAQELAKVGIKTDPAQLEAHRAQQKETPVKVPVPVASSLPMGNGGGGPNSLPGAQSKV